MKRTSTTTLIGIVTILLCFIILILTLTGLVHSSETMQTMIVQLVSSILILVLGFYFGATHKQNPENPKPPINMNPQVFWDIQSLDDLIDGTSDPVKTLKDTDPNYDIVLDDTNVAVLVVTTSTPVSLTLVGANGTYVVTSSVSSFSSGRPSRPR